jgi:uroporphyrinogen decarboxylase
LNTYEIAGSRELVKKTITGEHTGRIPKGELCITDDVICGGAGCEPPGFAEKYAFIRELQQDIIALSPLYPCNLKRLPQSSEYLFPDVKLWVDETNLFTFAVLDGAFEWGMRIFGLQKFCMMLKDAPPALLGLINQVEKLNLGMVQVLEAEGIDGILLADDIAYQNGLFASPNILREIFIPSLARQVHKIATHGLSVFFHSDGDYRLVLDDIVNCGVSGLQCLEKSAGMNIAELQPRLSGRVCLWGHLDVDDIAQAADSNQCRTLIEDIRRLASGGRFILGSTSGLFSGTDITLLKAIYSTL